MTVERGGSDRGYDGAKFIKGRKRHLLVDTLGLVHGLLVQSAGLQDRAGGRLLLEHCRGRMPRLPRIWADGAYRGRLARCVLQIVSRPAGSTGFVLLKWRWTVERTFGWLNLSRRLSKDYEVLPPSARRSFTLPCSASCFGGCPATAEFSITHIAELVDHLDKAPASIAGIVTNLRVRNTRKGERMAWLTLADATGAIEGAVFPNAYQRIGESNQGESPLFLGAFLVAQGRLAQEEATGSKLFIEKVVVLGGKESHLSALAVAIQEQEPDEWTALGA